jgi:drug/metabolite transporter (DMT)-like permease
VGLFVLAAAGFGTSFVGIKVGLASLPPVLFAGIRYDVATVALFAVLVARGSVPRPTTRGDYLGVLVTAVFLVAVNGVLLFVGQQFVASAAASVMYSTLPVLSSVLALALLPDTRVRPVEVVGILVGLVGVGLIVRPDPGALAGSTYGQALVGLAAVSAALGGVLLRRVEPAMTSLSLTAWATALGAVLIHATALALGEPVVVAGDARLLAVVVYVGVVATAVPSVAYFGLIRTVGPVRASLVSYAVPVVAAVAGWLVLDERLPAVTLVGFAVVFCSFALLERRALRGELRRLLADPGVGARSGD